MEAARVLIMRVLIGLADDIERREPSVVVAWSHAAQPQAPPSDTGVACERSACFACILAPDTVSCHSLPMYRLS